MPNGEALRHTPVVIETEGVPFAVAKTANAMPVVIPAESIEVEVQRPFMVMVVLSDTE
jgi:hypothetical protein